MSEGKLFPLWLSVNGSNYASIQEKVTSFFWNNKQALFVRGQNVHRLIQGFDIKNWPNGSPLG